MVKSELRRIQPAGAGKDVFVHATAPRIRHSRAPKGHLRTAERTPDGKTSAVNLKPAA